MNQTPQNPEKVAESISNQLNGLIKDVTRILHEVCISLPIVIIINISTRIAQSRSLTWKSARSLWKI